MNDTIARGAAMPPRAAGLLALLVGAALVLAAALGGCGYRQAVPRLPGDAGRLAIGPVRNHTFTGELDVRLREALRRRLLAHAFVRPVAGARSELVLEIDLDALDVQRRVDAIDPGRRVLTFTVRGRMRVRDRRGEDAVVHDQRVSAAEAVVVDATALETPAVRDEGIDDALDAFAAQVERRLLQHF